MAALNYNHLRYFWAVAHEGNLSRAAERLNLSQSALSVQIRKLEDRLGHDLFERRGRGLHLTEAGRVALDHADAIFAAGDELLGTLRGTGDGARPALRVGALSTLSRNFQIDVLRPVLGRPDAEVVLRSGGGAELLAALEALSLDVVLTNRPPSGRSRGGGARFVSHRLAEQAASLMGTPARLDAPGRPATAHAPDGPALDALLATEPLVLPTFGSGLREGFDALAHRLGVRPRIAAEADDMAMMRLLAKADVGLAVLPPIVVKDELASGALREAHRLPGVTETFFAVTVDRRFPNPLLAEILGGAGPARADG